MDSLDVRILRLLLQGQPVFPLNPEFRESFEAMAKEVDADPDTVRHRVKKLHDTGFIEGWRLFVNPRIWGGGQIWMAFDVHPAFPTERIVEELRLVPGATIITRFYGKVSVVLNYDDEVTVPRQVELVRRLANAANVIVLRIPLPECRLRLSARDWDLIRTLWKNPRKSGSSIAKELGISTHTVKRRLAKMTHDGVAFAWPALNPRGIGDGVLAALFIFCEREHVSEIDRAVTTHLGSYVWHNPHFLPYRPGEVSAIAYNMAVPNLTAIREILGWVIGVPHVLRPEIFLYADIFTNFEWYDEDLDRKLRQMPTAMATVEANTHRKRVPALRLR